MDVGDIVDVDVIVTVTVDSFANVELVVIGSGVLEAAVVGVGVCDAVTTLLCLHNSSSVSGR